MRPLFYSELDAATKKIGWIRTGENIKYYKNAIKYGPSFFYFTCYLLMTLQLSNLNCKWYPIGGLWKRVGSTLLKAPILFYVSLSASALINNHHSQHARINLSLAPFLLT